MLRPLVSRAVAVRGRENNSLRTPLHRRRHNVVQQNNGDVSVRVIPAGVSGGQAGGRTEAARAVCRALPATHRRRAAERSARTCVRHLLLQEQHRRGGVLRGEIRGVDRVFSSNNAPSSPFLLFGVVDLIIP